MVTRMSGGSAAQTHLRPPYLRVVAVLIVGAALLAASVRLTQQPVWFLVTSIALALVWVVGAWWIRADPRGPQAPVITPRFSRLSTSVATAVVVSASFLLGGWVATHIPFVNRQVFDLIDRTGPGINWPLIAVAAVTGVGEEILFRGALFSASRRYPVLVTTVLYTVVTVAGGNLGLVVAAAVLGTMLALARLLSGSVIPSIVGHVAWTAATVLVLPLLL